VETKTQAGSLCHFHNAAVNVHAMLICRILYLLLSCNPRSRVFAIIRDNRVVKQRRSVPVADQTARSRSLIALESKEPAKGFAEGQQSVFMTRRALE
jgi:hypothetical protein